MTWDDVLSIPGYSSAMIREELNRACRGRRIRVLEVGSWLGSTATAMCFGNDVEYIDCVDNWSEFGGNADLLRKTLVRFGLPATIHNTDLWTIDKQRFGGRTFNVYLYDGPHALEDHARELAHMLQHLEYEFLYIVDDFSWPRVREGCVLGLHRLRDRLTITRAIEFQSFQENDDVGYWNGMYMAWIRQHGRPHP